MKKKQNKIDKKWGGVYCNECGKLIGYHFWEMYGQYADLLTDVVCKKCYKKLTSKKNFILPEFHGDDYA